MAEPLCIKASVAAVYARACGFLPARVSMAERYVKHNVLARRVCRCLCLDVQWVRVRVRVCVCVCVSCVSGVYVCACGVCTRLRALCVCV